MNSDFTYILVESLEHETFDLVQAPVDALPSAPLDDGLADL